MFAQTHENLIKNPSFEQGLGGWKTSFQPGFIEISSDHQTAHEGNASVLFERKGGSRCANISTTARLEAGQTYCLSLYARSLEGANDSVRRDDKIVLRFKGEKPIIPWYPFVTEKKWKRYEYYFIALNDTLTLSVFVYEGKKAWFDNFQLVKAPLPPNAIVRGREVFNYWPRYVSEDRPFEADANAKRMGMLAYLRNPQDVYPCSIPQMSEISHDMDVFSTPGEQEPACFSFYALKDLEKISVELSDLVGIGGKTISKNCMDARFVKCWPQRISHCAHTYSIIPELLEKRPHIDVPRGNSQSVFLTIDVPPESAAGDYVATIRLACAGASSLQMNLRLRVLPFRLEEPKDIFWQLYGADTVDPLSYEKVLLDAKKHGINCVQKGLVRFKPSGFVLDWSDDNKRIVGFHDDLLEKFELARKKVGIKGPLILCESGYSFALAIAEHLKLKLTKSPNPNETAWPGEEMDQPWFKQLYKDALVELKKFMKKIGNEDWYFEGVDEPVAFAFEGRFRLGLYGMILAKEVGLKTHGLCNTYDPSWPYNRLIGSQLDHMVFNRSFGLNHKMNQKCLQVAAECKSQPWFYGSGSYTGQEGGLMPNRWYSGFLFWKTKAKGHGIWIYNFSHGDPFDDFDSSYAEPKDSNLIYPDKEHPGEFISTLQWEGVREGVKDYKYLHTLEGMLRKSKQSRDSKVAARAGEIEAQLNRLISEVPWLEEYYEKDFNNQKAGALRRQMAEWMMELKDKK
ncbi:MAG: carbohydrate binding domain-containing protein [Verrucomicrobiae bacterium]|nr:carbohydrate binding domain-containing protein [Verrucomicrobiae bacterium]